MSRVVTITFSPCIDKSLTVSSLIPEKKLTCSAPVMHPGGGGINVARAIHKLGGSAIAVYAAGGYTGKYLTSMLNEENIPSIVIETKNETRENIIVLEQSTNYQYRLGMPCPLLLELEWQALLERTAELDNTEFIIVSGSLPDHLPHDIFARIADISNKKKAKLIVDTSGEMLRKAVAAGVYLVKPNVGELSLLVGKDHLLRPEIAPAARQLIDKYNCEVIVVSMGQAGAMLVTRDIILPIEAPSAKRISTVGAGDSMVGGIVFSLLQGKSVEESAQYGVACGTAATMNPGTELCRREDADVLYNAIKKPVANTYIL